MQQRPNKRPYPVLVFSQELAERTAPRRWPQRPIASGQLRRVAVALVASTAVAQAQPPVVHPIQFAPGASSAERDGAVIRGERDLYALSARKGQVLSLRLVAADDNAALQLYRPGARPVAAEYGIDVQGEAMHGAGPTDDAARWDGMLPVSGAYLIVIGPTRGNAEYRLLVSVRDQH